MIHVGVIYGVRSFSLKRFFDARGAVLRIMRRNDEFFRQFGEVYCSYVRPNCVKGWHLHKKMTLNYVVISGSIELVLFDARRQSSTHMTKQVITLGESNYQLVRIPPGIWNGFKSKDDSRGAFVINVADFPHDPNEIQRCKPDELYVGEELVHDWRPYEAGW